MHIFNKKRATAFLLSSAFSGYQAILRLKQEAIEVRWSHWSFPSFYSNIFQNFPGTFDLVPEASKLYENNLAFFPSDAPNFMRQLRSSNVVLLFILFLEFINGST